MLDRYEATLGKILIDSTDERKRPTMQEAL